jgi:hypothetical protein
MDCIRGNNRVDMARPLFENASTGMTVITDSPFVEDIKDRCSHPALFRFGKHVKL